MSYLVEVYFPSAKAENLSVVALCELDYSYRKKFIFFGPSRIDVTLKLGGLDDIKPFESKADADITAQIAYLALRRRCKVSVKVVECQPIEGGEDGTH